VGRQKTIQNTDYAYIAGFLDGDGSVIVQIKNRTDTKRGWRLMFTICFYQDVRHEKPLFWIKDKLGAGYISHRNDGMTELRINGYAKVKHILEKLQPFIKFKKVQVEESLKILNMLSTDSQLFDLTKQKRKKIAKSILTSRQENYQSGSKRIQKLKLDLTKLVSF